MSQKHRGSFDGECLASPTKGFISIRQLLIDNNLYGSVLFHKNITFLFSATL